MTLVPGPLERTMSGAFGIGGGNVMGDGMDENEEGGEDGGEDVVVVVGVG